MKLVVGLGNPGKKFEKTLHNIGFRTIDEIAADFQFPILNFKSIFNAQISKGEIGGEKIILAKPQTFMNNSGQSISKLSKNYKLKTTNLFIIHDDIDLPLGKIRVVKNRGSAGHKGVQSMIKELKTKNFVRFRIGIQPKTGKPKNPEKFVLQNFSKEEEILKDVIKKTIEAVEFTIKEGLEKAMTKFNK